MHGKKKRGLTNKKKVLVLVLFSAILLFVVIFGFFSVFLISDVTLYEYYCIDQSSGTGTGVSGTYGRFWKGQTFTVGNTGANVDHYITSVKLYLQRQPAGLPGDFTVSIRAVDVNGKPTGPVLTSGVIDGNTAVTSILQWVEIPISSYLLEAGTKYAMIMHISSSDVYDEIYIRTSLYDQGTYTGGSLVTSGDSGVGWDVVSADVLFGEFGTSVSNVPPNMPSNPSPGDGSTGVDYSNVVLSWYCSDPEGDALTYTVYFGTSPMPPLVAQDVTGTSYVVGAVNQNALYYWQIYAFDGQDGTYGPVWFFTTGSGVTPPPPANNPPEIIDDSGNLNLKAGEMIIIWVKAVDDVGVVSAKIEIDGVDKGGMSYDILQTRWEYTFIAPETGKTEIIYVMTAYDADGLSDSVSQHIYVDYTQHATIVDQILAYIEENLNYIIIGVAALIILLILLKLLRRSPSQQVVYSYPPPRR